MHHDVSRVHGHGLWAGAVMTAAEKRSAETHLARGRFDNRAYPLSSPLAIRLAHVFEVKAPVW